ncbi:DUF6185 family protein [Streptomyces sp. Go40/10]|uniref:DUF6185 family protein n=1 Tax=Streptomyces sp. Go40/10 TaxID=2825844 RepID=UPI001E638FB1|nr:DUF6185 family protein [Streptomyces sp. Go40/10]UFR02500.1 DUF6185 family protein [Streptomyces sp. Go40/10]
MTKGMRWWQLLPLIVAALMWWGCPSADAGQEDSSGCGERQLEKADVHALIEFDQHDGDYVKIHSVMTVEIPTKWPKVDQLFFGESSKNYMQAMRCLLRGQNNTLRKTEWRVGDPQVTPEGGDVRVRYDSFTWIRNYARIQLGPWLIEPKPGHTWNASLHPMTLTNSHWHVEAKLGGLFDSAPKSASPANEELKWEGVPPGRISFRFRLPWKRWWLLSYDRSFWSKVGVGAWWVCASAVIALAALRGRPEHPPSGADGRKDSVVRAVLHWAALSGSFAVILILINSQDKPIGPPWNAFIWIPAGLAMTLVARPWIRGLPVQARAVKSAVFAVATVGLLVVLAPEVFELPPNLVSKGEPSLSGKIGYVIVGLAIVWLWLAAMTAWAWRFAREGRLVPTSWTDTWDRAPILCVAVVSVLLGVVAGGLLGCLAWVNEKQWARVAWPDAGNTGKEHGAYVSTYLSQFSFTHLSLIFSYSWILTGIALLALLHFRVRTRLEADAKHEKAMPGPEGPDVMLTASVFAFTVGLEGAAFAGNVGQYPIWVLLSIGSLFAVLAAGRRWSVLSRMGRGFCSKRLRNAKRRQALREKAHEYRCLEHQAQLLDQGRAADLTLDQLEVRQRDLRQWLVAGCGRTDPPPETFSVMDIALAWGPEGHWWDNAVKAAAPAFWLGLPASVGLLWLELHNRWRFMALTHEPTAIPEVVAQFFTYQAAWAAAGFVLGALWRLLPGRLSPVRAWSLVIAYAVPACLAVLLNIFTDGSFRDLLLYSLFMAVILTATSMWIDSSTFDEDRQYARGRLALLISVYRLQGLSVHIAWLLAQLVAATTLWQFMAR